MTVFLRAAKAWDILSPHGSEECNRGIAKMENNILRQLLIHRYEWMENRILQAADRNGYGYVSPAMRKMFGRMGNNPVSLSDLARRLSVSRQAVHKVANEALGYGLVEIISSEDDQRIKLIQFSARGQEMVRAARAEMQNITDELVAKLGEYDVRELIRILSREW